MIAALMLLGALAPQALAPQALAPQDLAPQHLAPQHLAPQDLAPPSAPEPAQVERRLAMMGTQLQLRIEAPDRTTALAASEAVVQALEAAEARLSTWGGESELTRLNRADVGRAVALSPQLAGELAAARGCWRETAGAFDPAIGALVTAWGLRTGGRQPSDGELGRALAGSGLDGLELLAGTTGEAEAGTAVRRRPGLHIDEGGFGKGAGLDAALRALAGSGATSAAFDLGGQWAFWGKGEGDPREDAVPAGGGDGWRVAVADPRDRRRPVVSFRVGGGSVATSGNSERGITVDGRRLGHLIDPRTGQPAPDFGSLTVWAPTALRADCLSTGLYLMGPDGALDWASRRQGVEVLILTPGNETVLIARATAGLAHRLEPLVQGLTLAEPQRNDGRSAARPSSRRPWNPARFENRATSKEKYTWQP